MSFFNADSPFNIFSVLALIGGLCLFLFGMNVMGESLERRAGNGLKRLLGKITDSRIKGFFTGLGVTAVIQSSSATTVMVIGFVNSGIMNLKQSIGVIMGANIGTTVTAWILSLAGISSDNPLVMLLKPTSFTPILALIGTFLIMSGKTDKKKDSGTILLGFATLMFGMDAMSDAVKGLASLDGFKELFLLFENPLFGVLAGALLTAIIQSSSASVGVLQVLAGAGGVSYAAAIPIIMGQNIGTCITAMLSSFGANRNAKRAAMIHLSFNVIGSLVWGGIFTLVYYIFKPHILNTNASYMGIAVCHSIFNILCTAFLLPMASLLEKLAIKLVPDNDKENKVVSLDDRLLATPSIALEQCRLRVTEMADIALTGLNESLSLLGKYTPETAKSVRLIEKESDHYEDALVVYLTKLGRHQISNTDSGEVSKLLKVVGDLERITDHSVNIVESAEEIRDKSIELQSDAQRELKTLCDAVSEIVLLATTALKEDNIKTALNVEPLEQVVDGLRVTLRENHIKRLKEGSQTTEVGFIWSDLLTNLERVADHCSNIALCVVDAHSDRMDVHESLRLMRKGNDDFEEKFAEFSSKYAV